MTSKSGQDKKFFAKLDDDRFKRYINYKELFGEIKDAIEFVESRGSDFGISMTDVVLGSSTQSSYPKVIVLSNSSSTVFSMSFFYNNEKLHEVGGIKLKDDQRILTENIIIAFCYLFRNPGEKVFNTLIDSFKSLTSVEKPQEIFKVVPSPFQTSFVPLYIKGEMKIGSSVIINDDSFEFI